VVVVFLLLKNSICGWVDDMIPTNCTSPMDCVCLHNQ
jgi:hypothetical protein